MKKKSRTMYTTLNIISGCMGQLAQTLFNFINRMVFARCLSKEYLGINGLFVDILSALSLAELGIGTAIVYELYSTLAKNNEEKTKALMDFYKKVYRVIGICVGCIGLVLIPFLPYFIAEPPKIKESIYVIYLFYLVNTVVSYFYTYKRSIIIADQKNYIVTTVQILSRIAQDIIQILILVLTKNFILYLICQIIMTITYNVVISRIADKMYPIIKDKNAVKLDKTDKKDLIINIKALMIRKIGGVLVSSTDNIIISSVLGLVQTGLVSNYNLLSTTLNSILGQVFNGVTASIGNVNALESKKKKIDMFYIVNFVNFWLYGWCAVSYAVVSNDIIKVVFGADYLIQGGVCLVVALNLYTYGMQNAIWTYRNTLGLFENGKYLALFTGIINVVLSIILGKIYGVTGILFATFLARLVTNIWYDPYSIFKYGFDEKVKSYFIRYGIMFLVVTITYTLTYLCCLPIQNVVDNMYVVLIYKLLVCIFIPNIIFVIVYRKNKDFVYLKTKGMQMIKCGINKIKI